MNSSDALRQPILRRYGLEATGRPSLASYNTHDEVDTLVAAVHRLAARNGATASKPGT